MATKIKNLMNRFRYLMNSVSFFPDDQRGSLETFVHEVSHLFLLFGPNKMKEILILSFYNSDQVPVNSFIKEKLKTIRGQDNNEIATTALTILATEQLGGSTIQECIRSMLGNLQAADVKNNEELYINKCVKLMMSKKMQSKANNLVRMLLDMEKDSTPT